ncbi:DUF1173 domain-containing protein [Paucibacter sp. XJ19-41]|uniref:DUF1173 domain-containing protein n=1 Tax=Paucibacter sp. XJ19-41 TaxID=2927824 RepID=UPI00234B00DF|nr:DUF1173 domain-containing protein [Paucibacter sp. XJ19-41]MDC6166596.1 DUF1173 domain-containing protein [Paucibacter sp. XJ19-41]
MSTIATEMGPKASVLELEGLRLLPTSPGFAAAVAHAYGRQRRPRCLCRPEGIEMYIARLAGNYLVKRMPGTGDRHAPACPSYEPPPELSGIRPLLGSAIKEDPCSGKTLLKLGFPLSRRPANTTPSRLPSVASTASSSTHRLSLRALLHYLWDQAELTRWHPGFEGRRSWGAVRRQLLQAASRMLACGEALSSKLDVPEPFSVEQADAIRARRHARWAEAARLRTGEASMLLLIAEAKEIVPARHGHKLVIKHVPDVGFALEPSLYHRLVTRFEPELTLWSAADDTHLIIIATFGIGPELLPHIAELSLMTVDQHWLPVETMGDKQLLETLVRTRRSFLRLLRYDLSPDTQIPALVLTDRGDVPEPVFVEDCDNAISL